MQVCPTCQSRIRVRNRNMIGQVAKCPKCGSSIKIAAPQQVRVLGPQGAAADSNTVTKESIPDFKPASTNPVADPLQRDWSGAVLTSPNEQPLAWQPTDKPLLSPEQWTSRSATRSRQILMVVFLGVTGSVAAAGLFYAFLRWASNPSQRAELAATVNGTPAASAIPNPNQPPASDTSAVGADVLIETQLADPAANEAQATATKATPLAGLGQQASSEPSALGSMPAVSSASNPPTDAAHGVAAPTANLPGNANADNPAAIEAAKRALPNALAEIQRILDMSIKPSLNDAGVELSAPPKASDEGQAKSADDANNRDLASDGTSFLEKQLATEIRAIAISGRSLPDAIAILVQMTNIPIAVDFDSLSAAKIDRNQRVDVKVQKTTVGDLLQSLVANRDLELRPAENAYCVLRGTNDAVALHVRNSVKVEGLFPSDNAQWWQRFIELFPDKQGNWQLADGTLSTDSSDVQHPAWLQCVALMEAWRGRSTGTVTGSNIFRTMWGNLDELSALSHVCQGLSSEPRPLGQTLVRVCREASLQCWLDWPHLMRQNVTPETTDLIVTNNRPLKNILAAFAEKHDLVIALEDSRTVFVTTSAAHRTQLRWFITPAEGKTADEWAQELAQTMPRNSPSKNSIRTLLSPDSKFVLVRAPRPMIAW